MRKYFNGFDGFDCREEIWNGVFHANVHGNSIHLREILSYPQDLSSDPFSASSQFTRKLKGENAWTCEPNKFFSYSENPQAYRQNWLEQLPNTPNYLEIFRRFMASVPENAPNADYERFLPSARKVCTYLEQILLHCGSYPADSRKWTSAGMYVLTAFFLQNSKSATPRFYCPPREYDPVGAKESTVVVPDVVMNPPEVEEIQFDFFLEMRERQEKLYGEDAKADSDDADGSEEKISEKISQAIARLELRPFSGDFTIIDPEGMTTYAYLLVDYLSFEGDTWCSRLMMRQIPHESETRDDDGEAQRFLVNTDLLIEDECHILLLTVAHDGSKGLLNTAVFTEEQKLYISRESSTIGFWDIDENGHYRDSELETLFSFCGVELTLDTPTQPVKWKKATSDFDPAYLQYLILDVQGRKEIPKTISRDPVSGKYKIHAMLPCPRKLIVMDVKPIGGDSEVYALAGYLHGAYGLKKNAQKAEALMRECIEKGDNYAAFEYGAYLRTKAKHTGAEKYLRQAAQANIAGAQFELAELLKDRGSQENIKEAHQLLNMLWKKGYRTYGKQSVHISGVELSTESAGQSSEAVLAADNLPKVTPAQLIYNICKYYGVDEASLKGRNRTREVSEARGVAMHLMKQMCGMGYYEIGKIFGRDSTATRHIVEQMEKNLQAADNKFDAIVQDLKSSLNIPEASFEHGN